MPKEGFELECVSIHRAENGFSVRASYERELKEGEEPGMNRWDDEEYVFTTLAEMQQHLSGLLKKYDQNARMYPRMSEAS